jgi:hypothetical protein
MVTGLGSDFDLDFGLVELALGGSGECFNCL